MKNKVKESKLKVKKEAKKLTYKQLERKIAKLEAINKSNDTIKDKALKGLAVELKRIQTLLDTKESNFASAIMTSNRNVIGLNTEKEKLKSALSESQTAHIADGKSWDKERSRLVDLINVYNSILNSSVPTIELSTDFTTELTKSFDYF